ncbi:(deoxy)nucleoside triphosphate pyrophosphohydrolase [Kribbella sp. NPDC051620]|uniref:(deoxy)nucleoside triphosphate pyrophosphohydrolase n=1 Tax=Kribbella sp. NPDC051620 TaxID=3364120 RepID=UPI0037BA779E
MSEPQVVVGVAVIRDGLVLAALRPGPDGGWEFPGGKVEQGETDAQAAIRELREELSVEIEPGVSLGPAQPIGDRYQLRVYAAALLSGEPVLSEHSAIRWVGVAELAQLEWLPTDRPFLTALRQVVENGT